LPAYRAAFDEQAVCHAPVPDYDPVPAELMRNTIRPFPSEADARGEQAVVHCSAGQGRTGQVLALWLAIERGYSGTDAIRAVSAQGRTPLESPSVTPESLRQTVKQISGQSE
jgi:protein-tyrosine phosphatase